MARRVNNSPGHIILFRSRKDFVRRAALARPALSWEKAERRR